MEYKYLLLIWLFLCQKMRDDEELCVCSLVYFLSGVRRSYKQGHHACDSAFTFFSCNQKRAYAAATTGKSIYGIQTTIPFD